MPPNNFVVRGYNKSALVHVIAWHRTGDKPLAEPTLTNSQTYIYIHIYVYICIYIYMTLGAMSYGTGVLYFIEELNCLGISHKYLLVPF